MPKQLLRTKRGALGSEYTEWDTQVPGFGVRVTAKGSKSFTFVYRGINADGRRVSKRTSLGRPGVIPLADARTKARDMYAGLHLDGVDPATAPTGFTLKRACDLYKADGKKKWAPSTAKAVESYLKRVCDDVGGERLLKDIRRAEVRQLHDRASSTTEPGEPSQPQGEPRPILCIRCRYVAVPGPAATNICFGGKDMRSAYVTESLGGKLYHYEWPRPGLTLAYSA